MNARTAAIENKIGGAIKWVMGIVGSLAVALILMFLNDTHTRSQADESDKREMRARLALLTAQLQNVGQHGTVVVAPPGTQTTSVPSMDTTTPLNPDDLGAAAGSKGK